MQAPAGGAEPRYVIRALPEGRTTEITTSVDQSPRLGDGSESSDGNRGKDYVLHEKIGSGYFGKVFRVTEKNHPGNEFALKVFEPGALDEFTFEREFYNKTLFEVRSR